MSSGDWVQVREMLVVEGVMEVIFGVDGAETTKLIINYNNSISFDQAVIC